MSLKLIKEAQVLSTLGSEELAALKVIQQATNKTIAQITEAFKPSSRDYAQWMNVVLGYSSERGINLNKKTDFAEVVGAVLENDPANPPIEMHGAIINKLWADYKASKHHAKVEKMAQAQEEEERVSDILRDRYSDDELPEDPDRAESDNYNPTGRFGTSGEVDHENMDQDEYMDQDERMDQDEDKDVCPTCGHKMEAEPDEEDNHEFDQEPEDRDESDLGNRVEDAERFGKMGGRANRSMQYDGYPYGTGEENEERSPMSARMGEEVKPKVNPKSILHQVLTSPRETMNKALKDITADGEAAWKAHQLPQNPHPKKSPAYNAWERGMKKAIKGHLGLDVVPVVAKPKRR